MFKKRNIQLLTREIKLRLGTSALISLKKQRFELIYLRFLKKILKKKHIKRKIFFRKRKFWFFLRPNMILTGKSTNSRMGAGVGALVRIAILLPAYKSFVEFKYYSPVYLQYINMITRYKLPIVYKFYSK